MHTDDRKIFCTGLSKQHLIVVLSVTLRTNIQTPEIVLESHKSPRVCLSFQRLEMVTELFYYQRVELLFDFKEPEVNINDEHSKHFSIFTWIYQKQKHPEKTHKLCYLSSRSCSLPYKLNIANICPYGLGSLKTYTS